MAIVRLEALRALKAAIDAGIPEFSEDGMEHVYVSQPPPNKKLCFPSLVIDPIRFKYLPDQADEHTEPSSGHIVENVGRFEATIQLRLASASPYQRMDIQERIVGLFLGTDLHPGVLLTPVTACESLGEFMAAWELDEDEWQDEKVFDQQWWGMAVLTGTIPALVTRGGTYTIQDLRLGLAGEFSTVFTPANSGTSSAPVEVVRIAADGTFVKL